MTGPHVAQEYLDGRVAEAERAAFEIHAKTCSDCSSLIESWQRFQRQYSARAQPLLGSPSDVEVRKLLRKAESQEPGGQLRRRLLWLAPVAVALCAVAVVWIRGFGGPVPTMALAPGGQEVPVEGDAVETAAQNQVLRVGEDRLGVAPDSRVRLVRRDRGHTQLALEKGTLAAAVRHKAWWQSFSIAAGRFQVQVVGTRLRVARLDDGLRVDVAEGHVRVRAPERTYDVLSGQSLMLAGGRAELAALEQPDFPELDVEPAVTDTKTDTKVENVPPAPSPAPLPEPPAASTARSPAERQLATWRRGVVAGQCRPFLGDIRKAASAHPEEMDVWRLLADCQRLLGENRDAARAYGHVIARGQGEEAQRARLLLADVFAERLGENAKAEQLLRAYLSHREDKALEAAVRVKLARILIAQGQRDQARSELDRVIHDLPSSPAALEALHLRESLHSSPEGGP